MKYNRQTPCVYHFKKVMFHGIPKNASTSVKNALYEMDRGSEFEGNKQWVHKGNEKGGSIYPSIEMVRSNKFKSYLHFSVVRNPYDRFKSFYNDLFAKTTNIRNNIPPFYIDNKINLDKKPINDVLDIIESFDDDICDEHFASQHSYIYTEDCMIIKLEHINQGWKTVCQYLDVEYKPLPVYNKSNDSILLTDSQRDRIYNRYKKDFERFNYER